MRDWSSAGIGAKRCYNIANGARRNAAMTEDTLAFMVMRDRVAASHYWSGNYLGAGVLSQLWDHERELGAVTLTSNRCALDKVTWKIAHDFRAPVGFASWRDFCRARRNAAA